MSSKSVTVKSEVVETSKLSSSEGFSQIGQNYNDFKVGQKYPSPSPGNGDRVFYETLLQQRPDSEMAQDWCLAYGILSEKEAAKVHAIIMKRKKNINVSPQRASSSSSQTTTVVIQSKKNAKGFRGTRTIVNEVDDDDFAHGSGWEGIGVSSI